MAGGGEGERNGSEQACALCWVGQDQPNNQPSAPHCMCSWSGDDASEPIAEGGQKETPAKDLAAEAAATRAVARAAVRQGAAARAKTGGRGGKKSAKISSI